ncbi:MAG: hypothetical protein RI885_229 [Actinomycetota bacterium]|jgi:AcrR family transcriptional regulator
MSAESVNTPTAAVLKRGRPRSTHVEDAVHAAALELLGSQGYTRMTLDQVAAASGVSKSTIHLRWRSKADLVTASLESLRLVDARESSGELRRDLAALLGDFVRVILGVRGMSLIGTCLAEEAHTPDLLALLRSRTVLPRRELLLTALASARARGELRPGVDDEMVVSMLLGALYADYLAGRVADADLDVAAWADRAVDAAIGGALIRADGR